MIHPSGYYAWKRKPESARCTEDARLLGHIKQSWLESGAVYGYRQVHDDLREQGECCGRNRVHRLMREASLRSQTRYGCRPGHHKGKPSVVTPNLLQQQFEPPRKLRRLQHLRKWSLRNFRGGSGLRKAQA